MSEIDQEVRKTLTQDHAGLYLTFSLANEMYGVRILAVQEIIQLMPTTAVPCTPEYVRGVINLRGKVIPVIDLRTKFGMKSADDTAQTCVVVIDVTSRQKTLTMGIIVDAVSEVLDIAANQIEPPPAFGASVQADFIMGMGKVGQKIIILLDINRALTGGEVDYLDGIVDEA